MKAINKMLAALALVVVLVLGAVITAAVYSNGFESLAPLYLTDGENVIADSDKAIGSYTVEVLPNPEYDFDYTADGKNYRYSTAFDNLTAAFDISETQGGFEIKSTGGVLDILSRLHGGAEISAQLPEEGYAFLLHIYTDYGESYVAFNRVQSAISIVLDPDRIIFYNAKEN